jgi:hypothetical protein
MTLRRYNSGLGSIHALLRCILKQDWRRNTSVRAKGADTNFNVEFDINQQEYLSCILHCWGKRLSQIKKKSLRGIGLIQQTRICLIFDRELAQQWHLFGALLIEMNNYARFGENWNNKSPLHIMLLKEIDKKYIIDKILCGHWLQTVDITEIYKLFNQFNVESVT